MLRRVEPGVPLNWWLLHAGYRLSMSADILCKANGITEVCNEVCQRGVDARVEEDALLAKRETRFALPRAVELFPNIILWKAHSHL